MWVMKKCVFVEQVIIASGDKQHKSILNRNVSRPRRNEILIITWIYNHPVHSHWNIYNKRLQMPLMNVKWSVCFSLSVSHHMLSVIVWKICHRVFKKRKLLTRTVSKGQDLQTLSWEKQTHARTHVKPQTQSISYAKECCEFIFFFSMFHCFSWKGSPVENRSLIFFHNSSAISRRRMC